MPNPTVLSVPTVLYSAMEPQGRLFQAGEPWPGDIWSANVGGVPIGGATAVQATKDLAKAQEHIDTLSAQLVANGHDLAVMASEREAANDKVAGLEQRAIAAEKAQAEAEDFAKSYMDERDTARSSLSTTGDKLTKTQADLEAAQATVADLAAQLATANQTIADLNGKLAAKPAKAPKAAADVTEAPAEALTEPEAAPAPAEAAPDAPDPT